MEKILEIERESAPQEGKYHVPSITQYMFFWRNILLNHTLIGHKDQASLFSSRKHE